MKAINDLRTTQVAQRREGGQDMKRGRRKIGWYPDMIGSSYVLVVTVTFFTEGKSNFSSDEILEVPVP